MDLKALLNLPTSTSNSSCTLSSKKSPTTFPSQVQINSEESVINETRRYIFETLQKNPEAYTLAPDFDRLISYGLSYYLWPEIKSALDFAASRSYLELQYQLLIKPGEKGLTVSLPYPNFDAQQANPWDGLRRQTISQPEFEETAKYLIGRYCHNLALALVKQTNDALVQFQANYDIKHQQALDCARNNSNHLRDQIKTLENELRSATTQHEGLSPPCPDCGRDDVLPEDMDLHRHSRHCVNRRDFKVLYICTIYRGKVEDVAEILSPFDKAYNDLTSYKWHPKDDPLRKLSSNGLFIGDVVTVAWLRWIGTLPNLVQLCHRLDFWFSRQLSKWPPPCSTTYREVFKTPADPPKSPTSTTSTFYDDTRANTPEPPIPTTSTLRERRTRNSTERTSPRLQTDQEAMTGGLLRPPRYDNVKCFEQECAAVFQDCRQYKKLKNHLRIKHGWPRVFQCTYPWCGAMFTTTAARKAHCNTSNVHPSLSLRE